jgi:hypothetical protein
LPYKEFSSLKLLDESNPDGDGGYEKVLVAAVPYLDANDEAGSEGCRLLV